MSRNRNIQALHAGISRRDWNAVESAANALRDEHEAMTRILAGTDVGSLPNDMTLSEMAQSRMKDFGKPVAWISLARWERMTNAEPWLTNTVYSEDQSASFACVPLFAGAHSKALDELGELDGQLLASEPSEKVVSA